MPRPAPQIIDEGNFYVIRDVEIGLKHGFCLRPTLFLFKEVQRYGALEKAFLERHDPQSGEVIYSTNFESMVDLIGGEFSKGSKVTIKVSKDLGEKAQELLLRLYNGLTSITFYPYFEGGERGLREIHDEELLDIWRRY